MWWFFKKEPKRSLSDKVLKVVRDGLITDVRFSEPTSKKGGFVSTTIEVLLLRSEAIEVRNIISQSAIWNGNAQWDMDVRLGKGLETEEDE